MPQLQIMVEERASVIIKQLQERATQGISNKGATLATRMQSVRNLRENSTGGAASPTDGGAADVAPNRYATALSRVTSKRD